MKKLVAAGAAFFLFAAAGSVSASVLYTFTQSGGNVVGNMSGSIDTAGLLPPVTGAKAGAGIEADTGFLVSGADGASYRFLGAFAAQSWGSGGFNFADSSTGDLFVVNGTLFAVPLGYVSGTALSGTMTFLGETFAGLGITPGSYVYTLADLDTITIRFTTPEPATLALLGLGLAGLGFSRRRNLN